MRSEKDEDTRQTYSKIDRASFCPLVEFAGMPRPNVGSVAQNSFLSCGSLSVPGSDKLGRMVLGKERTRTVSKALESMEWDATRRRLGRVTSNKPSRARPITWNENSSQSSFSFHHVHSHCRPRRPLLISNQLFEA